MNLENQNETDKNLVWTEKEKIELLKTPVFTVTQRKSLGPNGIQGTFIVNEARDWGVVIPVYEDCFLMVKQWRHGEKSLSIEFPGGVIEQDEKPEDGVRRELLEETGAVAEKLTHLGTVNPNPALFANHFHIFLAEDLSFTGSQKLDKDEFLNFLKIPKTEVIKKMGSKEYPHALMASALGLYLASNYSQK